MAKITDFGFTEEVAEEVLHHFLPTNYPKPILRWRVIYEIFNQAVEDLYFKAMDYLSEEMSFPYFDKITDIFAASEQSAFFGVSQQRMGLQQDKVSQFLATIGKMVKELFQLVREIRIIDERLQFYHESYKGDIPAEITLKGYWIDMVEGGGKNPASVYGMAREVGFITLPDLFFNAPPMKSAQVNSYCESLEFNTKVKEVLKRKLKSFIIWKENTFKEHMNRRTFTIKYLRQHYDIIKMYMQWVKPYMRNIARLHMDYSKMDSAQMVSAFEGSMIEIEVLAKKPVSHPDVFACYLLHFDYRSRPEMKFQQEGYNRGPMHVGRTTVTLREYAWSSDDIRKYKEFKAKEDFDLLATIDSSVQAAYTALGDDLEKYLYEAGEPIGAEWKKKEKEKESPQKPPGLLDPFVSAFKGITKTLKHDKGTIICGNCGEKNENKVFCKNCGNKMREPNKKEALEIEDALKAAAKYCKKKHFTFIKRYKATYGWVY